MHRSLSVRENRTDFAGIESPFECVDFIVSSNANKDYSRSQRKSTWNSAFDAKREIKFCWKRRNTHFICLENVEYTCFSDRNIFNGFFQTNICIIQSNMKPIKPK